MAIIDHSDMRLRKATKLFARLQDDAATDGDRYAADAWRKTAVENEDAWRQVAALWAFLGDARDEPLLKEIRTQALENADAASPSAASRAWVPVALAACLVGLIGAPAIWWMMRDRTAPSVQYSSADATRFSHTYTTGPGQRTTLRLSDDSTVKLNGDTQVTIALTDDRRMVGLTRGQAYFSVHKDKHRPFVVDAGSLQVVAVGTAFDVRKAGGGVEVTTTEGLVSVAPQGKGTAAPKSVPVPAGSKLSMQGQVFRVASVDVDRETIWTKGLVIFQSNCLSAVAEDMNRYAQRKLKVAPSAANLTISGTFQAGKTVAFARALEQQGLLVASDDGTQITLSASADVRPSDVPCRADGL